MLNTYQDYYYKTVMARGWSGTHLLCLFIGYLIIALPFYLSFSTQNFWLDTHSRQLTLTYNHTLYYSLQVNYQDTTTNFITHEYSNIPGNAVIHPNGFSASFTVKDYATSGKAYLSLTGYGGVELLSINAILYFQVGFEEIQKNQICALMVTVPGNVLSAQYDGSLKYISSQPISAILSNTVINLPPYYPSMAGGASYSALANELVRSSLLLEYKSVSSLLTDSAGSTATALRSVSFSFTKERRVMVCYYPSILQTLKFRYSCFLAFAIIFYFIFKHLLANFIGEGLLECWSVTDKIKQ